jgi:hypothetical protein
MKAATKKPANGKHTQPSIVEVVPNDLAKKEFVRAVGKPADGDNSYVECFVKVIDAVTAIKSSFTLDDVIYYAVPYNMPAMQTKLLFEKWCDVMLTLRKITVVDGCYSQQLICVI